MDCADWRNGSGQRAAERRYGAVYDWARAHNNNVTPTDLVAYMREHRPEWVPMLSGLPPLETP